MFKEKGFTLIELFVVVTILFILFTLVFSMLKNTKTEEIKGISEKTQTVINEVKKLAEKNMDIEIKVKKETPKETKQSEVKPKVEDKTIDSAPQEGMKKL